MVKLRDNDPGTWQQCEVIFLMGLEIKYTFWAKGKSASFICIYFNNTSGTKVLLKPFHRAMVQNQQVS